MSTNPPPHDPAKAHFITIQLVRWTGTALVCLGLLVLAGKVGLPTAAGYVLAVAGLTVALIVPTRLTRRWKSPPR